MKRLSMACLALALTAPAQSPKPHSQPHPQQIAHLGHCTLESGKVLSPCDIGYRTFGTLDATRNNAVLMPTWLYGTSADLAPLFGPGDKPSQLIDTTRFFGVALDAFGNGVSTSPSNSPTQHGPDFPAITTADIVEAEYRVATEVLHLSHAHAVVGLSMGGEQTFMWAVRHPAFFDLAVPVISTPRLTVFDRESKQIMLDAIRSDPDFHDGHYNTQPALRVANLYNAQAVSSPDAINATDPAHFAEFIRKAEAPVPLDANDRVTQLTAVMTHDVLRGRTIEQLAPTLHPRFLIIVSARDHMVVPTEALRWAAAIHAPTYTSQAPCAHLIMTCDATAVSTRIRAFLAEKPQP